MQPVTPETLPETIRAIRDAYEEAKAEYGGIDDGGRMFLYGMRYVMCILGMPEGQSLNGDLGGVRDVLYPRRTLGTDAIMATPTQPLEDR